MVLTRNDLMSELHDQAQKLEDDQAALDRLSAYLIEHHVEHFGEVAESGHLVDVAIAVMREQHHRAEVRIAGLEREMGRLALLVVAVEQEVRS